MIFLPPCSVFAGWCFPGGCSRSPLSLLGPAAVQSCHPFSLPAPPVFLLQELGTLRAATCSATGASSGCARVKANSRGGRGKGLEEMGKDATLLPAAAGLSPRSVLGWKGSRNGSDLGAPLGLDGCSDPLLSGPGGCGKLVLAGEHCLVHLHTCLGISSAAFQPASDLGWKAVGLAPYILTPAPLKPSPACFLGSLHFGAELWGLLPLPTWPVPELSPLGPSQGHPLGSSWGRSQWMQGWAEHTPKPLYGIKSAGGSWGTLQSENSVTGDEGCPQTLSYVLG